MDFNINIIIIISYFIKFLLESLRQEHLSLQISSEVWGERDDCIIIVHDITNRGTSFIVK